MNTSRSPGSVAMRARSPSSAPPVRFEVGSTASTATLRSAARQARTSSESSEDLPAPGGPVTPTTCAGASPPRAAGETSRSRAATSSRAHGDLLGAVGVAVQPRLADEDLQRPAEALGHARDLLAQRGEVLVVAARDGVAHSGGGAVGAEHVAQRLGPLAGRGARAGRRDRGGPDVLVLVLGRPR